MIEVLLCDGCFHRVQQRREKRGTAKKEIRGEQQRDGCGDLLDVRGLIFFFWGIKESKKRTLESSLKF